MNIETQVSIDIARSRDQVFAFAAATENLPQIFPGKGPIPGIKSAHAVGSGEVQAGTVRKLQMSDGSELDESFTEFTRPHSYTYRMTRMLPPLSYLVTEASGRWVYTELGNATHVTWTYSCHLTSPLIAPFAALLVKVFMRSAMEDCLKRLKAHCEKTP